MENKKNNYWLQIIEDIIIGYHDTEPNLKGIDKTKWSFIKLATDLPYVYIGANKSDIKDEAKLLDIYNSKAEDLQEDILLNKLKVLHSTMSFKERMGEDISKLYTEFEDIKLQYYNIIN
jgi:hypothetical protein